MQGFALSGRTFHCLGKFVQIGGATGEHGEDGHQAARATWIMHVWPGSSARPYVLSAIVLVYLGRRERLGYDSFWHIFIARQHDWSQFWSEVVLS